MREDQLRDILRVLVMSDSTSVIEYCYLVCVL